MTIDQKDCSTLPAVDAQPITWPTTAAYAANTTATAAGDNTATTDLVATDTAASTVVKVVSTIGRVGFAT